MKPFAALRSRYVVLPVDDVDTDQIIPARFLTTTTRDGLGAHLFADWRFDVQGRPRPAFALNAPSAAGCAVLVAGRNFGCGSSREHAPWALADFGFRAVLALGFADIFRANALKNGLLPVAVPPEAHAALLAAAGPTTPNGGAVAPGPEVGIDLGATTLTLPDGTGVPFAIDAFARACLLEGRDELEWILARADRIAAFEAARRD